MSVSGHELIDARVVVYKDKARSIPFGKYPEHKAAVLVACRCCAPLCVCRYPLADSPDEFLPVATTRPETILGDTAVAVHPEDERYKVGVMHIYVVYTMCHRV